MDSKNQVKYQAAASYNGVRNFENYFEFFRKNSNRESGWLDIKFSKQTFNDSSEWLRRFVVFEHADNTGGILKIALSPEQVGDSETCIKIPMENVVSFRTDNNLSDDIIKLQTTDFKLSLKANSLEEVQRWLFTFQKSVALVLSLLMKSSEGTSHKSSSYKDDSITSMNTYVGHGHGVYDQILLSKPNNIKYSNFSRQKSIDSDLFAIHTISDKPIKIPIYEDNSQWGGVPTNNIPLAKSPAVKIDTFNRNRNRTISGHSESLLIDNFTENNEKLAKSFNELENNNILDKVMKDVSKSKYIHNDDEDDISMDDNNHSDELLFSLDEMDIQHHHHENANVNKSNHHKSSNNEYYSNNNQNYNNSNNNRWKLQVEFGSCSKLGPRETNEDRHIAINNFQDMIENSDDSFINDINGYFAVYDGHCGADAAIYLQENLHLAILNHPLFNSDIVRAITETCIDIDKKFLEICKLKNFTRGSTALGVFLIGKELILFNIGDSGAVISKNGKAEEIMQTHKPNRPDEKERILQAKGWITEEKELFFGRLHMMDLSDPIVVDKARNLNWVVIHRVCGEIAVSRSIGDHVYKNFVPGEVVKEYFSWPEGHDHIFMEDLVIPTPECTVLTVSPSQEFLIIASDGLWDVVTYQEAIDRVRDSFNDNKSPTQASEELSELALRLGSSDNVTVVIVKFTSV